MVKIGNLELEGRAVLAPMAGVTDRAFRELCTRFGASYVVSEMVSSKGLQYNDKNTGRLMELGGARAFSSLATNPRSWRWLQKRPWRTIRT